MMVFCKSGVAVYSILQLSTVEKGELAVGKSISTSRRKKVLNVLGKL